jgi:hypothetical protein
MSFDMTIRFDRRYSKSVGLEPRSKYIATLPNIRTVRTSLLVYEVLPDLHMEISLETASPDGESEAPVEAGQWRVNCIRLHTPYDFMEDNRAVLDYYLLAQMLMTLLGWKLYDQQKGKYVKFYPCSYTEDQKVFDRMVLGISETSDTGSTARRARKSSKGEGQSRSPKQRKASRGKKDSR